MNARLQAKIQRAFHPTEQLLATELLETVCNDSLPLIAAQGETGIFRIRCAVVKISLGSIDGLKNAIHAAQTDWRDVLVAADFASNLQAHEMWLDQ